MFPLRFGARPAKIDPFAHAQRLTAVLFKEGKRRNGRPSLTRALLHYYCANVSRGLTPQASTEARTFSRRQRGVQLNYKFRQTYEELTWKRSQGGLSFEQLPTRAK